jgi:hypothetical protein
LPGLGTRCSVVACAHPVYGRQDVCEPHYRRRRRTGNLDESRAISETVTTPCMVDGCINSSTERGLCHGHYLRPIRLGDVQADQPLGRRRNHDCSVNGCGRPARGRGLCGPHLARQRTTDDIQADVPIRTVQGTGYIHHGYRVVPIPPVDRWLVGGRTSDLEHRYVMSKMLGRRWQPSGQRVADKIRNALELIERYAPELLAGSMASALDV